MPQTATWLLFSMPEPKIFWSVSCCSNSGSGMDTPLTALKMLFPANKSNLVTYMPLSTNKCFRFPCFFYPASLPLFCASATGKPPLRCNSERDATARKYLELNHPLPTHGLLTCIGPYWENMQSLPNKSCQPCQPCYFLETQGQAKISLQRTTGHCVARRFTPELITCKSVNLYMQHPADFALKVCLYGAGFPCTPFSLLHWGSQLLQEQEARQMYRVLDNIKDCQPAATCSM